MTTQKANRVPRGSLLAHKRVDLDKKMYDYVIALVAKEFDIPVPRLICKRRHFELVMARNMAFYILHTTFRQRASQIAPHFKRDRTTILHAVNNFQKDLKYVPFYMERYESILDTLGEQKQIYALS